MGADIVAPSSEIAGHVGDAADAHAASAISLAAIATLAADDVQAGIAEVVSETNTHAADTTLHTPLETTIVTSVDGATGAVDLSDSYAGLAVANVFTEPQTIEDANPTLKLKDTTPGQEPEVQIINVTKRIMLGTATRFGIVNISTDAPISSVVVAATGNIGFGGMTSPIFAIHGVGQAITLERYGGAPQFVGYRAEGSIGAKTAAHGDGAMGLILGAYVYDGTDFNAEIGEIRCVNDGPGAVGSHPSAWLWRTCPVGSDSGREVMRLDERGWLNLGVTTSPNGGGPATGAALAKFHIAQVWTVGGTIYRSLLIDVTDTASAPTSMFLDFQVAGVSKYRVTKDGISWAPSRYLADNSFSNLFTLAYPSSAYGVFAKGGVQGGTWITGMASNPSTRPLNLLGYLGSTSPTVPAVQVTAAKWNGTTWITDIANNERAFSIVNNATAVVDFLGDGSIVSSATVKTADPGAGRGAWKLGQIKAGVVALDTANYVEVMIDGTLKKLLVAA